MAELARLLGLAVATPRHVIRQEEAAAAAAQMFSARFPAFDRLAPVFLNAGIRERRSVRPLAWFHEPHGWADRMAAFAEGARALFLDSARAAIARSGLAPVDIDCVVTLSSTGFTTPSLEAQVAREIGFRSDIERVPVFGLGCAGGVSGLGIAARLAAARPGANVLLVVIELCTLAFRLDEPTGVNLVATALFGDGAAACVVRAGEGGVAAIESAGEHLFPDSLDIMGWKIDDTGLGVVLAQSLPPFVRAELAPALDAILGRAGLTPADIDRFVCHPGGTKVLEALEAVLPVVPGAFADERAVLADYGNMSSPTVLFVLERALAAGLPNRAALLALGPGFTASCVTLRSVS
ncbi:type III polyketide synthase [Segnochrobactrum spirostomi]|uniref:Type III polyketide synthase n=1 Tax=Segnochrobactrum spirostomi TaxID=2608987 RepID=A0A6A7Y1R9_9HYPH|nr:type III polyketide synthase [Segnochrobactrum spirostomi]MQT11819.1 type III polyketide synthase [Segnochrobactrum spirostomi]